MTNDHTAICFDLGSLQYGEAVDVTLTHNRIHGCGRLPPTNHEHGVYDEYTSGAVISYNMIYDNADRGINIYPAAYNGRIYGNVIDGNGWGVLFAGEGGYASSGNYVYNNVIAFSEVSNVASSWTGRVGSGNVLTHNCIWAAHHYLIDTGSGGFRSFKNIIARPRYNSRHPGVSGNFRIRRGSRCARVGAI